MSSVLKVDQIQSDTGTVNLSSNVAFTGTNFSVGGPLGALGNKFEVQDASSSVMEVRTTSGGRRIRLQASDSAGALIGTSSNHGITFMTNNTGRLSIPADAAGITFPASQAASADPNTLDDYEEGTFTPALAGSTTNPSVTYSFQVGRYTKIGNRVLFNMQLIVTAVAGQGTGIINITGLPFAAAGSAYENVCPIGYNDVFDTAFPSAYANGVTLTAIPTGVTQANAAWGSPATGSVSPVSTGYLAITGSYNVA
jgi:hypothetical protein